MHAKEGDDIGFMTEIYDWLKEGFTAVPNRFFQQFYRLDLSSDEALLLLYILSASRQNMVADDMQRIGRQLGWSHETVFQHLNSLMSKNYLTIELVPDETGKQRDHYSLRPFFEQLDALDKQGKTDTTQKNAPDYKQRSELIQHFEEEFGRSLTQMELEQINQWLLDDQYDIAVILLALKEAVIHQALSLKYIDTILLNWEKRNIRTVQEAQAEINRRNQRRQGGFQANQTTDAYQNVDIPIINWSHD